MEGYVIAFVLGIVAGMIIKEFLPPDVEINQQNKIKKSNDVQIDFEPTKPKKKPFLKRIFKRKKL